MQVNKRFLSPALASILALFVMFSCKGPETEKKESTATGNPKLDKLKLPAGFHAEHLFGPSENGDGSWVAMTFDDKGRLIASDQYGALYRMQLPVIGDTSKPKIEKLVIAKDTATVSMGYAHGLLYAFNSLYVVINNRSNDKFKKGSGRTHLAKL